MRKKRSRLFSTDEEDAAEAAFDKSQSAELRVPEWKVLLALAYGGPRNRYQIVKSQGFQYPLVHRAIKTLESIGWIRVFKEEISAKNVKTKTYGLTSEGLLWLFSKIPRTIDPSLIDNTPYDATKESTSMRAEPVYEPKLKDLENQHQIHFHLLQDFDYDKIAENFTSDFPLIFQNWEHYKKNGIADYLTWRFPDVAFSSLIDYFHNFSGLRDRFGTLEQNFTYRVYRDYLEHLARSYASPENEKLKMLYQIEEKQRILNEIDACLNYGVEVKKLVKQISTEMKSETLKNLDFLKCVKAKSTGNKRAKKAARKRLKKEEP